MVESNFFDWLWKLIDSFVPSIERHPGTAAWVQAVFSVVAIAAAVWVAQWQTQRNIRHERRIREEDAEAARCRAENEAEESRRRLAGALCAELNGLVARFLSLEIMSCYKQNAAALKNSNVNSPLILKYFSASQNYTAFYDNSSTNLHLLDEDMARDLVRVYIDIKGCLDTVNLYSAKHFWCIDAGDPGRRKDLAQQYRAIAAYINDTLKEADGIANKLDSLSRGEPVDDDD